MLTDFLLDWDFKDNYLGMILLIGPLLIPISNFPQIALWLPAYIYEE